MKTPALVKDEQINEWDGYVEEELYKYVFSNRMTLAMWDCYAVNEDHATYLLSEEYDELEHWFLLE